MRKSVLILFILTSITLQSQEVSSNPTRPSAADNAYLTHYGYTEIELGWFIQENYWSVPGLLKFTFLENLELGMIMSGIVNHSNFFGEEETELGDPGVQLKGQILNQPEVAIALVGRADFLPASTTRGTLYSAFSFPRQNFQVDLMVGGYAALNEESFEPAFLWALAVGSNFDSPLNAYVEVFGEKFKDFAPIGFDAGISYTFAHGLVLDAAYFTGLNDEALDNQFHIGFTKTLFQIIKPDKNRFLN